MEQRKAERKDFTRTLSFRVSTAESRIVICGSQGVDISSLGLGVLSDYRLARGMVLQLSLPIEEIGVTLPLFAEVARVSLARESFRAGLRFLK
jgi:hypothetical protein